jgi:CRP-like cAMP-binding protein
MDDGRVAPLLSFLARLDADDRGALEAASRRLTVQPGTTVFVQGDRSERVVVVIEGLLRIGAVEGAGAELLLAVRGPGDILGDQAALDDGVHGQTVVAMTGAELLSLAVGDFIALLESRPGVSMALHRMHVSRLREADARRLEQATLDVPTRLARRLAELRTMSDGDDLVVSQRELAQMIGASREAVTKGLARLAARGAVVTRRGGVTVADAGALARAAGSV